MDSEPAWSDVPAEPPTDGELEDMTDYYTIEFERETSRGPPRLQVSIRNSLSDEYEARPDESIIIRADRRFSEMLSVLCPLAGIYYERPDHAVLMETGDGGIVYTYQRLNEWFAKGGESAYLSAHIR